MIARGALVYYCGPGSPVIDRDAPRPIGVVISLEDDLCTVQWPGGEIALTYSMDEVEPVRLPDRADPTDLERWLADA